MDEQGQDQMHRRAYEVNGMQEQKNRNRDIYTLRCCKGMLDEIRMLTEKDAAEQRAILGSPRYDGMPHGGGAGRGLDDLLARAQSIHEARMHAIERYEAQVAECEAILLKISDTTHRTLIRALYVDQLPMWRAAEIAHMSETTVKRIKSHYESREHF